MIEESARAQGNSTPAAPRPSTQALPTNATAPTLVIPVAPSPVQPIPSAPTTDDEKRQLEKQKLQLEIASLQKWWVPYIPGFITALGVAVAFIAAWKTGVFEARNLKLQADNAVLEARKIKVEMEVAAFTKEKEQIVAANEALRRETVALTDKVSAIEADLRIGDFSTFARKLRSEGTTSSAALDDLVRVLKENIQERETHLQFLDSYIAPSTSKRDVALLLYARYLALREPGQRAKLFQALTDLAKSATGLTDVQAISIIGDARWPDEDRSDVAALAVGIASDPMAPSGRAAAVLREVARLHTTSWNPRTFRSLARPATWFRLDERNRQAFLSFVILARDIALNQNEADEIRAAALWAVSRVAPPAVPAIVSELLRTAQYPRGLRLAHPVQDAMDLVNVNMLENQRGPATPKTRESSLDEYAMVTSRTWEAWRTSHGDALHLWLERDLGTLRAKPQLYDSLFEDRYG